MEHAGIDLGSRRSQVCVRNECNGGRVYGVDGEGNAFRFRTAAASA